MADRCVGSEKPSKLRKTIGVCAQGRRKLPEKGQECVLRTSCQEIMHAPGTDIPPTPSAYRQPVNDEGGSTFLS